MDDLLAMTEKSNRRDFLNKAFVGAAGVGAAYSLEGKRSRHPRIGAA